MLADTDSMKPYYPSMKIDFDSGRELEIDSMFGVPIERAKQAGTEMPGVSMLYDQLRFMVQRRDRDRSSVT
jgi:2-dehydropantoate 2-reductase